MNWRRIITLVLVVFIPLSILVFAIDPLNRFMVRLEFNELTGQPWRKGFWTPVDLPKSATPQNLVDRVAGGDLYEVLETKRIWKLPRTSAPDTLVALVNNNGKRKICVFQYVSWTDSWQARIYGD